MFDLDSIKTGGEPRRPLTVIYGTPGVGKTTFASKLDKPLCVLTEDGIGDLDIARFPLVKSYEEFESCLNATIKNTEYNTLVIDSLSALEPLIWDKVARDNNKSSIGDIGYAKGENVYAPEYWKELTLKLKTLLSKGIFKQVVLLAHADIIRHQSPEVESFDRYQIKLHRRAFHVFYENSDIIGFASPDIYVKKSDDGKRTGVSKGGNILYLKERPSLIAKNRYSLPEKIPFDADTFLKELNINKGEK